MRRGIIPIYRSAYQAGRFGAGGYIPPPGSLPLDPGEVVVTPTPTGGAVTVDYITIVVTTTGKNKGRKVKGVIYDDDGTSGKPLTQLYVGDEVTITVEGNIQLTFAVPPTLTDGTYYFGVVSDGTLELISVDGVAYAVDGTYASIPVTFDNPPEVKTRAPSITPHTAPAYTSSQALVNKTTNSAAAVYSWENEVKDTGSIWALSPNPTRLVTPANAPLVRIAAGSIGVSFVPQRMNSKLNNAFYTGKLMGGGYSDNAGTAGNATSAIVPVAAGDYFEILNETLINISGEPSTWAGLETIDPSRGHGLFTNSSQQALTISTWGTMAFDTEVFDTQGVHSTVTNNSRITIPSGTSGLVRIGGGAEVNANASNFMIRILKNGTTIVANHNVQAGTNGHGICTWSYPMVVVAGDYFEIQCYVDASSVSVLATTGIWACYEELDAALKYCVVQQSGGGSAVGTNTNEDLLWPGEIVDTNGFHSTVSNTSKLVIPSGQGITQARFSFSLDGGGANTGNRTIAAVRRGAAVLLAGAPLNACQTSLANYISGFGTWIDVTAGDSFYITIYGGARTFTVNPATWFCCETR